MNTQQFYINGAWITPSSSASIAVVNPADESCVCTLAQANKQDVELAISAAKHAFKSYSTTSVAQRLAYIEAITALLIKRNDEIAAAISTEMGAPLSLSREAQAPSGAQHFAQMAEVLKQAHLNKTTSNGTLVKSEAIGVCALITPWNWPLNQIATKVAPALAAGCTMVLKPSEVAPLDAIILAEIIHEAGVPAGVFNLIHGSGVEIGEHLTSHPDVDMVSFTGSTRAGIAISHSAAPSIKRVSLELGGKSAGIIAGEVDADIVAAQVISSSMTNTGQSCNALTRLLIPAQSYDTVSNAIAKACDQLSVDLPSKDPVLGPLANSAQFNKVNAFIALGIDEGASLLAGGIGRPAHLNSGFFVKPTVFGDVKPNMRIAIEEIFGPVLCLMRYHDVSEAIDIANDSEYGLSGYVWSQDHPQALSIAEQMRTGMVHLNGSGLDSAAPFGGYKHSGNGREWGEYGLHEFLEYKSIYGGANR